MAANVYLRSFTLASGSPWVRLADAPVVLNAEVRITATSTAPSDPQILMRFRGGDEVACPIGGSLRLEGVDLCELEVTYSNVNVRVFVLGYSRGC